jgi:hypothetical protein
MASYTHEKNDYREPGVTKLLPWTRMRLLNPDKCHILLMLLLTVHIILSVQLLYISFFFQLSYLMNESIGTLISTKPSGSIIFANTSNPVIVLGPGLLKYAPALTTYTSLL